MNLKDLRPERLTAKVAPHVPAIRDARERGVGWKAIAEALSSELGETVGAESARRAFGRAVHQIDVGRLAPPAPTVAAPQQAVAGQQATPSTGGFKSI